MSEQKHTPGPWHVEIADAPHAPKILISHASEYRAVTIASLFARDNRYVDGRVEVNAEKIANARRIVARVNACEGLSTEQLERFPLDSFKECAQSGIASTLHELELEKQRDELLTLLEAIYNAHRTDNNGAYMGEAVLCESFARRARDLIAKCKEG